MGGLISENSNTPQSPQFLDEILARARLLGFLDKYFAYIINPIESTV